MPTTASSIDCPICTSCRALWRCSAPPMVALALNACVYRQADMAITLQPIWATSMAMRWLRIPMRVRIRCCCCKSDVLWLRPGVATLRVNPCPRPMFILSLPCSWKSFPGGITPGSALSRRCSTRQHSEYSIPQIGCHCCALISFIFSLSCSKTRIAFENLSERIAAGQSQAVAANNTGIELTRAAEVSLPSGHKSLNTSN